MFTIIYFFIFIVYCILLLFILYVAAYVANKVVYTIRINKFDGII